MKDATNDMKSIAAGGVMLANCEEEAREKILEEFSNYEGNIYLTRDIGGQYNWAFVGSQKTMMCKGR